MFNPLTLATLKVRSKMWMSKVQAFVLFILGTALVIYNATTLAARNGVSIDKLPFVEKSGHNVMNAEFNLICGVGVLVAGGVFFHRANYYAQRRLLDVYANADPRDKSQAYHAILVAGYPSLAIITIGFLLVMLNMSSLASEKTVFIVDREIVESPDHGATLARCNLLCGIGVFGATSVFLYFTDRLAHRWLLHCERADAHVQNDAATTRPKSE